MGEVVRTFMPMRMAERYVEILLRDGREEAYKWWKTYPWYPSAEEYEKMNTHMNNILNNL